MMSLFSFSYLIQVHLNPRAPISDVRDLTAIFEKLVTETNGLFALYNFMMLNNRFLAP